MSEWVRSNCCLLRQVSSKRVLVNPGWSTPSGVHLGPERIPASAAEVNKRLPQALKRILRWRLHCARLKACSTQDFR